MLEIERRAAGVGLTPEILMENAGRAVAQDVKGWLGNIEGLNILILAGPGNNGGDGLVTARYLHDWGARVSLYLLKPRKDTDVNYQLTWQRGIRCIVAQQDVESVALKSLLSSVEVVIDALFGTGKIRPIEDDLRQILGKVAEAKERQPDLRIAALDLPSGLDSDTGAIDSACLSADITITLAYPKQGLFAFPGATRTGSIVVTDIGIPSRLAEDILTEVITDDDVRPLLPKRPLNANKGTFGSVLVTAGSINYIGAAYLACTGAARTGAGLVTLATASSLHPILASRLIEVTHVPLPEAETGIIAAGAAETLRQWLPNYQVLLLGCGLGQKPEVAEFIKSVLFSSSKLPGLVIDADALNALSKIPQWWQELAGDAVFTPHPGEMSRLTGIPLKTVLASRLEITREKAVSWQKTIVLKGAYTIIASPDGRAMINPRANAGLASAGTGDVLAGVIAGLLAQGLSPFDASVCGVYIHSQAGEIVKKEIGDAGMLASDLLPALPSVIKRLREKSGN